MDVYENNPLWQLIFVPDSPTASLFFTIAAFFLLYPPSSNAKFLSGFRKLIEALAVVTSVKYGIWAIAMIVAGAALGGGLVWQHYMLMASHLAMAVEALLFVRFFTFRQASLAVAGIWTLLNDTVDYTFGVYPTLSYTLSDHLTAVRNFTVGLTLASILSGWVALKASPRYKKEEPSISKTT